MDLNTLELTKVLKRRKANNLPVADNTALPQEDKVDCLTTEVFHNKINPSDEDFK